MLSDVNLAHRVVELYSCELTLGTDIENESEGTWFDYDRVPAFYIALA